MSDTRTPGADTSESDDSFKQLTRIKLKSDIEQLSYLRARGLLQPQYTEVLQQAKKLLAQLPNTDTDSAYRFKTPAIEPFAKYFNRSLYQYRPGPLRGSVLSANLDIVAVLHTYLQTEPAVVTIEELLSEEALLALQRFCTESSIWFQSRFRFEVGATLVDGFLLPAAVADCSRASRTFLGNSRQTPF